MVGSMVPTLRMRLIEEPVIAPIWHAVRAEESAVVCVESLNHPGSFD
jgi:hypothetical protein